MAQQRVVIVTGAGSGIGRATAVRLGELGWATVLTGRTESKLRETADRISGGVGAGSTCVVQPADLSDAGECERVVAAAEEAFGRIDALANIAGYAALEPIARTTPDVWQQTVASNTSATVYMTHFAWPIFERQGSGVIVNVSSMASIDPFPGFAAYAAAKVAVNMFTRVTAREGEAIGLRAVTIIPGAVETPMLRSLFGRDQIPPDATVDPARVGQVICDCMTGARRFESGEALEVTR